MEQGFAIVVDIGKTLSKITLWSRDGVLLEKFSRRNEQIFVDGIQRLDERGIACFVETSLARFSDHPIEFIVPVAHGAAVASIANGRLAFTPIDYEQEPPRGIISSYRANRDPFAETGSPALPASLNFGIQLFWADTLYPNLPASTTLLPWAQYWAWFLSGTACSEVTSLGCHSDVWNPVKGQFSNLAIDRGWADRFAPLRHAGEQVGTLRPELAKRTGLSENVRILAGLHDSNAALLAARGFAEIEDDEATILSTGTWFIAMRLAHSTHKLPPLAEKRDCLVNVDPFGRPVPSSRFMGGREIECLVEIDTRRVDIKPDQPRLLAKVPDVIRQAAMVLPTLAPGNGPFPDAKGGWINRPDNWYARRAGACLYAALVADASLELIGSKNKLLIEGRFAEADVFIRALASLRPDTQVFVANAHNDVSFGAIRLVAPALRPLGQLRPVAPLGDDLSDYSRSWRDKRGATV